jgi:hypothetical protein
MFRTPSLLSSCRPGKYFLVVRVHKRLLIAFEVPSQKWTFVFTELLHMVHMDDVQLKMISVMFKRKQRYEERPLIPEPYNTPLINHDKATPALQHTKVATGTVVKFRSTRACPRYGSLSRTRC